MRTDDHWETTEVAITHQLNPVSRVGAFTVRGAPGSPRSPPGGWFPPSEVSCLVGIYHVVQCVSRQADRHDAPAQRNLHRVIGQRTARRQRVRTSTCTHPPSGSSRRTSSGVTAAPARIPRAAPPVRAVHSDIWRELRSRLCAQQSPAYRLDSRVRGTTRVRISGSGLMPCCSSAGMAGTPEQFHFGSRSSSASSK